MTWLARLSAQLPGMEDATALVRRASTGHRASFDRLVHLYETQLRGFVALRVGQVEVDDVAQEIWMTTWSRMGSLKNHRSFKAWLYGIAVNKCYEACRGKSRSPATMPIEESENVPAAQMPLDESVALRDIISRSLETLPNVQRDVLELYYYSQLTLPEIASALTRNLNTVKYQFYRAHETMATVLAPIQNPSDSDRVASK